MRKKLIENFDPPSNLFFIFQLNKNYSNTLLLKKNTQFKINQKNAARWKKALQFLRDFSCSTCPTVKPNSISGVFFSEKI